MIYLFLNMFTIIYNNFTVIQIIRGNMNKYNSCIFYAIFLTSPKVTIIFLLGAFIKSFIMVLHTCNISIWKAEAGEEVQS